MIFSEDCATMPMKNEGILVDRPWGVKTKMNKIERIRHIREIITREGQCDVSYLSRALSVSGATIRTDLEELENEGFLSRYHGGAALNPPAPEMRHISLFDQVEYTPELEQLGEMAARMVQDHEGIFLGPGKTAYYIALALRQHADRIVNVVTNSFLVAGAARGYPNIRLHFIGGFTGADRLFTVPGDIGADLRDIYLDKYFFSIDGIDLSAGYTLSDSSIHNLITAVARHSKKTILVAEVKKFGKRSFMKIGDLSFAPMVITSPDIPEEYRSYYAAHGTKVYTGPEDIL